MGYPVVLDVRDERRGRLSMFAGDRVCLLGDSGAGKTRWVRSLLGLEDPFDVVSLWGEPASREQIASVAGWVPEGDGVLLSGSVLENVILDVGGRGVRRADGIDALDQVGLAARADEAVAHLTRAERRRVALARCLARRASLLIVDTALDPVLWSHLPMLCSYQPWIEGVLVTETRVSDFTRSATSVALLSGGVIVAQGPLGLLASSQDPAIRHQIAMLDFEGAG